MIQKFMAINSAGRVLYRIDALDFLEAKSFVWQLEKITQPPAEKTAKIIKPIDAIERHIKQGVFDLKRYNLEEIAAIFGRTL